MNDTHGFMVYINDKPIMWSEDLKMLTRYVDKAKLTGQPNVEIRPTTTDNPLEIFQQC